MKASPSKEAEGLSLSRRLGWVAFFNDCSSEVIARALPLFLTTTLGVTPTFVGVVEGAAEAVSILLRGFSGWVSDRLPSRKPLVMLGYGLSALSRLALLKAQIPLCLGTARVFERSGKGMRAAPRDAMVADAAALGTAGHAFGITRLLDSLGAVTGIGLVLAFGLGRGAMTPHVFSSLIWISAPPALLSLLFLWKAVPAIPRQSKAKAYLAWKIPHEIRGYLIAVFLFSLGNSSDAFLVLKAREVGFSFRDTLALLAIFNLLVGFLSVPVGKLSDRYGRLRFLVLGWGVYAVAYAGIGSFSSPLIFATALCIYGAFYGFTESVERAMLADLLPAEKRGAGYGALQLILGLAALPASLITGVLMTHLGSKIAFNAAAGFAVSAIVALLFWRALNPTPSQTQVS